ncbi:STP1 protein [Plasmodium ovale wallikeri]|uniref:STP1 protein n=2 Tax=Plasmodium ovale TaxID=36330 RepID=A0A1A8YS52_PLAOA|nr:STP1 protein [Plasmodium ovale wallikeri]SBT34366.1 STP1 protein [Plasmodium ovale wallikeri]SBT76578.1 STP1 protein [Plasmodium ovale]
MENQPIANTDQTADLLANAEYMKWKDELIKDFLNKFNDLSSMSNEEKCNDFFRNLNYWIDDNRDDFIMNKSKEFGIKFAAKTWNVDIEKLLLSMIYFSDDLSLFTRIPYKFPKSLRSVMGELEDFIEERDKLTNKLNLDCKSDEYLTFKEWLNNKKIALTKHEDWKILEANKEIIRSEFFPGLKFDNMFKPESYCKGFLNKLSWDNLYDQFNESSALVKTGFVFFQFALMFLLIYKNFFTESSSSKKKLNKNRKKKPLKTEYFAFYPVKPKKAEDVNNKNGENADSASSGDNTTQNINNGEKTDDNKENSTADGIAENILKKNTFVIDNDEGDGIIIIDVFVPAEGYDEQSLELKKEEVIEVCRELFKNRKGKKVPIENKEMVKNGKKYMVM